MQTSAVPSVDGHDVLTKSDKVLIVRSRRQRHRTPRGQLMLRTIRKFPRNRDSKIGARGIVFPNHVAVVLDKHNECERDILGIHASV